MGSESETSPRFSLLGVGVVGGILAGFFGVGGGIVMVPLLVWWASMNQRQAQASSLLAIAPAAVVGAASYGAGGVFPLLPAVLVALGATMGAQLGAYFLRTLSLKTLRWTFISFVTAMSLAVTVVVSDRAVHFSIDILGGIVLVAIGLVMGISSGLFGIGGGIVAIPLMIMIFGVGDLEAKGTSLIAMVPAALSGSIANLRHRVAVLRDGVWIAGGALIAAPLGSSAAFLLPANYANPLFGGFACVMALSLGVKAFRESRQGA